MFWENDCLGVAGGTAVEDDCMVCDGNNASKDECGVCDGDNMSCGSLFFLSWFCSLDDYVCNYNV